MEKPIVFLSHASKDSKVLNRLKTALEAKTQNTIDFFLSSDGESIPFGRNWVATIQQALERAALTFVFLSPQSVSSGWVHFESGFVYGKGVKVIPLAMPGLDLKEVPAPLNLLQGFNIHSHESLNNIFAVFNEQFETQYKNMFSEQEYRGIFELGEAGVPNWLGINPELVMRMSLSVDGDASCLESVANSVKVRKLEFERYGQNNEFTVGSYGFSLHWGQQRISIEVSAYNAALAFEILDDAFKTADKEVVITGNLWFSTSVSKDFFRSDVTARLLNTPIRMSEDGRFVYKTLKFYFKTQNFSNGVDPFGASQQFMEWTYTGRFKEPSLPELLSLLFSEGILRSE